MHRTLTLLVLLSLVTGCALWPFGKDKKSAEDADANTTEQVLYRSAQSSLRSSNFRDAIEKLERLEARFPFGRYAEQAQLELIYAHYESYEPEAARSAADRFIRLHPQHPSVDYAFYMKGIASFYADRGFLDRFRSTDVTRRDQTNNRQAFADFSEFLTRYPESNYAADARQRMVYLRNVLAGAELQVANYYMRRAAWVAAANRARNVVEHYDRSQAVPDALAILIETNWRLGLEDASRDALKVLAHNYPDYPAFDEKGRFVFKQSVLNSDRSWLNMMTFGLLSRPEVPPPILIDAKG
jgi:outer membrane protein assembly factor BamD